MGRPSNEERARAAGQPGRPRGTNAGQIADRLRTAVTRSLDILDREGEPLHKLLAESFKNDPVKTMTVVMKLLPQQIETKSTVDINVLHLEAVRALNAASVPSGPVVDVTPVAQPMMENRETNVPFPEYHPLAKNDAKPLISLGNPE